MELPLSVFVGKLTISEVRGTSIIFPFLGGHFIILCGVYNFFVEKT